MIEGVYQEHNGGILPGDREAGRPAPPERAVLAVRAVGYRVATLAPRVVVFERGGEHRGRQVHVLFREDDGVTIARAAMWLPRFGASLVDPSAPVTTEPDAAVIASPDDEPGGVLATVLAWLDAPRPREALARAAEAGGRGAETVDIPGARYGEGPAIVDDAPWSRPDADPLEDLREFTRAAERQAPGANA